MHSWNNAGEADDWEPAMGQIYTERMERMERKGRMAVRQYW